MVSRAEDQPIVCECCGLEYYDRTCPVCKTPFKTRFKKQICCSDPRRLCYQAYYHKEKYIPKSFINQLTPQQKATIARMKAEAEGKVGESTA